MARSLCSARLETTDGQAADNSSCLSCPPDGLPAGSCPPAPSKQLPDSLHKFLNGSDLLMLSHLSHSSSSSSCSNPPGYSRQESRDSLIEVALDNTEQIVAKLLGKNSRVILNSSRQQQQQLLEQHSPLLDL
jgi:hypothetical protein